MITQATILGERCSGTNFLESALFRNFDLAVTWDFGWKHFFGFADYRDNCNTLFVGIVRDPHTWINSFFKIKWHLQPELKTDDIDTFLNAEFWSYNDGEWHHMLPNVEWSLDAKHWRHQRPNVKCITKEKGAEIMEDRNIYTKKRYKNIFESRQVKCRFLLEDMPLLVQNYILIRYEDLRDNYEEMLNKIKEKFNLRTNPGYPIHIKNHKGGDRTYVENTDYKISEEKVWDHPHLDLSIEKNLGYPQS